ncbi:uncharacterized protein LOC130382640 isoform X1 [Gadus chalcogrammus]|uniref:uncharacterized protein LOC130382640 isoform X1 n=1 Tax=Gadus chalcogrammus TaxID=1042646 RepID=UPI0024C3229F|nr:uncharacterized protein LOC130382640 isoform X1 [Gadus chalcogrammus]
MGRMCAVRNCGKIPQKRSCHRLPLLRHNTARRKLWLSFLGLDVNTPLNVLREADHRVCAFHFRHEDYMQSTGLRMEFPKKLHLQKAAVPTLLGPTLDEEDLGAGAGVEPFVFNAPPSTPVKDQPSPSLSLVLTSPQPPQSTKSSRKSLSGSYLAFPVTRERSSLFPDNCKTEMLQVDISSVIKDESGSHLAFPVTRERLSLSQPDNCKTEKLQVDISSVIKDEPTDMNISINQQSSSTSSSSASEEQGELDDRKWIVNESSLMTLFRTCHTCAVPITDITLTTTGSQIKIEWTCLNNHNGRWASCPDS